MNKDCFALRKNHDFNTLPEMHSDKDICYVLRRPDYDAMRLSGKCCTKRCPFYKTGRAQIRTD